MKFRNHAILSLFCLLVLGAGLALAQAPTGSIAGTITDESGGVIPNAAITVTNKDTGLTRTLGTGAAGVYNVASLPAGNYGIHVEAAGFQTRERIATVQTGSTTRVDFLMKVGTQKDVVMVAEAAPQIDYESHKIDGVVNRQQIQSLPLNGRNFLQLAFLEPGVTVAPATLSQYNAQFSVSILGAGTARTRITVDGVNANNPIEGGSQQNFSQEVIQEFQVSSLNFDLSTGITGSGSINIVTRSGGNDWHGAGYFYYRDHNMAAYPGLSRDPRNPDPFFARRQSGFYLGGPAKKDKLFFFVNLEHNNQDAVIPAQPLAPEFAKFGGIFSNPYTSNQISTRFDYRFNSNNNLFLRYSHDGNNSFGPRTANSLPSNWVKNVNWSDSSVGSLTTTLRPTLVNEARFAYTYWHNRNQFPSSSDCPGCIGLGFPQIDVTGAGFVIGNTTNAPQGRDLRHYITADNMTWQRGTHRLRFGGEWDHSVGTGFWAFLEPAAMVLYSPSIVNNLVNPSLPAPFRIQIPATYNTIDDILKLPLAGFQTAVGDPSQPPPFQVDRAKPNNRFHTYWQDTWRVRPRFTLNYGLAYSYESNQLNHDLNKPAYLQPLLGPGGLTPERHDANNFSPSVGFSWAVTKDNKTVIRGGAGIYYDTTQLYRRLVERATIGPKGNGRFALPGSFIPNPYGAVAGLPAIPCPAPGLPTCVSPGQPLSFTTIPTYFTGGNLVAILPAARAGLAQQLGVGNTTDLSIRNIEVFKTTPFPDGLITNDFTLPYAEHFNFGIQREMRQDLVVGADFAFRQTIHQLLDNADYNHWVDPAPAGFTARSPVLPRCVGAQALDPKALCSNGAILVNSSGAREHYKALLLKVDKRFSNHYQFLASYAYSSSAGWNGITNQDNWFDSFGPNGARHILNFSGIVSLPWDPTNLFCSKKTCEPLQISVIQQNSSRGPFNPVFTGVDFNGDGTSGDRLPGVSYNAFNRSRSKSDFEKRVADFNSTLAGTRTSRGQLIPRIVLPANYNFGDRSATTDLRLSKVIAFRERYKITLIGEAFNLFNVANLGGYGNTITQTSNFGQPSNRTQNSFGSGGPRAFQVAARFTF